MKTINKVTLLGYLGNDPLLRTTKKGTSVGHFSVATVKRLFSTTLHPDTQELLASEEKGFEEETQWHSIVTWGKTAQHCQQWLKKGDPVYVEGTIRSHSYTNSQGQSLWKTEVHCDTVVFLKAPLALQPATALPASEASDEGHTL